MSGAKHSKLPKLFIPLYSLAVLGGIYYIPRMIVNIFGESSPWASYFYQYGLGFLFFLTGMIIIQVTGAAKQGRGSDTKWLRYLWIGFVIYAAIHAWWILLAISVPFKGDI